MKETYYTYTKNRKPYPEIEQVIGEPVKQGKNLKHEEIRGLSLIRHYSKQQLRHMKRLIISSEYKYKNKGIKNDILIHNPIFYYKTANLKLNGGTIN